MILADKKKVDEFIKDYILIDPKVKIVKAKIEYEKFKNNKSKIKRYTEKLNELEKTREIVESNVKVEYLEMLEIFRLTTNESIEEFGILRHNLFKLKNEIREEFYKVLDIVEAE